MKDYYLHKILRVALENTAFKTIKIPDSVTVIDQYAFGGCRLLENITIPNGVTTIGSYAFANCKNLMYLVIPETTVNIGSNVLADSANATIIGFVGSKAYDYAVSNNIPFSPVTGAGEGFAYCETDEKYEGMILRFASQDGEKEYTKILTANSKNAIYGLDTKKTYKADIVSRNGNVFCSKSDISFGDLNSVSIVFENTKKPLETKVKLEDEEGNEIEKFTANWTDKNGKHISGEKILNERIEGEVLNCEITLDKSLMSEYKIPEKASITLSEDSDNTLTITLEKQEIYTLSGVISNSEDDALTNVFITLSHTLANGEKRVYNTFSDGEGKYSFLLCGGDYQLTVSKNGYFDKTVNGTLSKNTTEDIVLEKLSGAKIGCKLNFVNIKDSVVGTITLDELDISIYNKTQKKAVESFTLENNVFYFDSEDVFAGDILEFTCKGTHGTYSDTKTTVTYTGSNDSVTIEMIEKGKISCIIKNTNNNKNIMLVFDSNGKYLDVRYFSNLTASLNHLNEGQYTVVVMGENTSAFAVDSMTTLEKYGFVDKVDYQSYSVEVKQGEITEIKDIDVPELNDNKMIYLDSEKTSLSSSSLNITLGQFATLKAEYCIKDEFLSKMTDKKVIFTVPENLSVPANGVSVDGISTDYTFENGILTVNVTEKSGIIRVVLYNVHSADKVNVSARLHFTLEEKEMIQPIGSVDFKLGELDFRVPLETSQKNITAFGTTFADSKVVLYDNGIVIASVKSNKAGSFVIPFELENAFKKSTHQIWVEITKPDGTVLRSQTETVEYAQDMPVLSKVSFVQNGQKKYIDFLNPNLSAMSYSFAPSRPVFTFEAEFVGDVSLVKNVVIVTTDSKGRVTEIPTVYDAESGTFVGSHSYTSDTIPAKINVEYDNDYDNSSVDMDSVIFDIYTNDIYVDSLLELEDYFKENPIKVQKDSDGNYVFIIEAQTEECNAETRFIIPTDTNRFRIEQYVNGLFIGAEETVLTQIESKNEVVALMKDDGYEQINDLGDAFEEGGMTAFYKIDLESGVEAFSFIMDDGYMYEQRTALSGDMLDMLKIEAENTPKNLIRGWFDPVWIWNTLGGSGWLNDWAKMDAVLEDLDYCREQRGLPPTDKTDYNVLKGLRAVNGICASAFMIAGNLRGNWASKAQSLLVSGLINYCYDPNSTEQIATAVLSGGMNMYTSGVLGFIFAKLPKYVPSYYIKGDLLAEIVDSFIQNVGVGIKSGFNQALDSTKGGALGLGGAIIDEWGESNFNEILDDLRKERDQCYEDKRNEEQGIPLKPSIDPSGYICEAVDSNRVQGVTCTIFYSPNADGSNAVVWDASEYEQQNPLISDENGYYEWFVPVGYWQVKYEKEGYATTYSDWLPVPPPQTEVNVAMTALDAPKIKNIYAYQNEIDIEFTQYMNIYTVTDKTITVTLNGEKVTGKVVPVNSEPSFDNPVFSYASKFRFVPDEKFSKGDKVKVSIANAVNYADNTIEAVENEYEVILKPELIKADETVNIKLKDTKEITIQVEPGEAGANQNVTVTTDSVVLEILTPNVTTDSEGKATVKVRGSLPGQAEITYQLENSDCVGRTTLTIEMPKQKVEPVTASVKSGTTLNKGDKIELSCATDGAEIYYTTDLSCPCILTSDARIKYTGSIEITEYTTIIAYAVKDGMEDSKTTLFIYNVNDVTEVTGDVNGDGSFSITDVTNLQKYLANTIVLDEETVAKCDFNNDGKVNISDVTFMQKVLANLAVFA